MPYVSFLAGSSFSMVVSQDTWAC